MTVDPVVYRFSFPEKFDLVLPVSRKKWLLIGSGSLVLGGGGFGLALEGDFVGWLVAGFFFLALAVSAVQLLPGASYLRIDDHGMEYRSLFRLRRFAWSELEGFGFYRQSGQDFVGFKYRRPPSTAAVRASMALVGFHDALPDTYGKKADELAALLTACRAHYLTLAEGSSLSSR